MAPDTPMPTHVPEGKAEGGVWVWRGDYRKWIYKKRVGKHRGVTGADRATGDGVSLQGLAEMTDTYDTLDDASKKYVEKRVKGLSPTQAMREVLMETGQKHVTVWKANGRASEYEKRLRPLIENMLAGEAMPDGVYDAWEDRMVRGLAEDSKSTGRLMAIKWLREKREEKKYGNEESLKEVIAECDRRMAELDTVMAEATTGTGGTEH